MKILVIAAVLAGPAMIEPCFSSVRALWILFAKPEDSRLIERRFDLWLRAAPSWGGVTRRRPVEYARKKLSKQ